MTRLRRSSAIGAFAIAFIAAFLAYIGYLGGPVFVVLPATSHSDPAMAGLSAVVLSGDMGFRIGMAPRIARKLADDGIPVVGVNSLTFFRHRRTPQEVTALIIDAARRAVALAPSNQLVLIGQSFGADMLHVGLAGAGPALRNRVRMVALVVPGETVSYRASPADLLGWSAPAPALKTARALSWAPLICIHGIEESTSLCPHLRQANMRSVALPGGHLLRHDADALEAVIVHGIKATDQDASAAATRGGRG
jgi:type IV secretory pathway VirJ component